MGEITVILNGYKRPQFLKSQIDAINNQTVKPKEIMLWLNNTEGFDSNLTNTITTASSNKNFGVWSRFAYALNAKTEYICIFDDDTVPGEMWFENCLETMKTHEGLLGTIGLVFHNDSTYSGHVRYGWDNPNNEPIKVDIVGHCWFFKREWLSTFWRELPPLGFDFVGEDLHFSYTLQKYLGINTYVPPHPNNNQKMWGSLRGWELGLEQHAISFVQSNHSSMNNYYKHLINKGFKLVRHEH